MNLIRPLALPGLPGKIVGSLVRGGAVWQLVGLITRRSQVQILPPLPIFFLLYQIVSIALPSAGSVALTGDIV